MDEGLNRVLGGVDSCDHERGEPRILFLEGLLSDELSLGSLVLETILHLLNDLFQKSRVILGSNCAKNIRDDDIIVIGRHSNLSSICDLPTVLLDCLESLEVGMLCRLNNEWAIDMHLVSLPLIVFLRVFNRHSLFGQKIDDSPLFVFNSGIHDLISVMIQVNFL